MFAFGITDNPGQAGNTVKERYLAYTLGKQGFSCEIIPNKFEMNYS